MVSGDARRWDTIDPYCPAFLSEGVDRLRCSTGAVVLGVGENCLDVEYDMRGFLGRSLLDQRRRLLDAVDDFATHVLEFTEDSAAALVEPVGATFGYGCDLAVLLAGVKRDLFGVVLRLHNDSSGAVVKLAERVVGLGSRCPSGRNRLCRSRRPECSRRVYGTRVRQLRADTLPRRLGRSWIRLGVEGVRRTPIDAGWGWAG